MIDIKRDGHDELIGRIHIPVSYSLKPWDEDDYWMEAEGTIVVAQDDDTEETAGQMKVVVVKMAEAINGHVNLLDVFDGYSEDLEDVYHALFNAEGDFKEELRIECAPCDILFIEAFKLEPKYTSSRLFFQAVEAAIAMFASQGLVISYMGTLDFGQYEWTRCGFEAVTGTEVVFRDNVRIGPGRRAY